MCTAHAQSSPPPLPPSNTIPKLAPVVVTGVLPGPALWKVSKGDHVMWILGLTSPVPKNMQWKSAEVEHRIATSQAVLKAPSLEIGVQTGFLRSMLMPTKSDMKNNPNDQTLQDVLTPELYRHWRMQKANYLPGNESVERMRPIFAGRELYESALKHHGLVDQYGLERTIYKKARRDRVDIVDTSYRLMLSDPGDSVRSLDKKSMDDQRCLGQILDALDQDLAQTTARANAWATGDIDTLKSVLAQAQQDACLSTVDDSPFAKALGLEDIEHRVEKSWISIAERALDQDTQTVAVLPIDQLLASNGYLSVLQSDGYVVEAPTE
ncbi:TraB/GumN family protein [Dyella lipolytica]|uniref:TraB/GumN family protein n=1 Tax=Dyella lipolytica TaxID=1867835 RepID=A0ABW8IST5_9GAMM|nr:TraB/GumN family protein [Dyella lipolytica]